MHLYVVFAQKTQSRPLGLRCELTFTSPINDASFKSNVLLGTRRCASSTIGMTSFGETNVSAFTFFTAPIPGISTGVDVIEDVATGVGSRETRRVGRKPDGPAA